jgi:two-component system, chemotaxis family, protein-glutamate methylesterase/glutaminase
MDFPQRLATVFTWPFRRRTARPSEINEGELVRYRCHVGHAYSAEIMSLALEERVALARKLQAQASESGLTLIADSWANKAVEFEAEARVIRDSIQRTDEIAARFADA